MDPTRPVDVVVQVESPHVVRYQLFVKPAGEGDFAFFAEGTDQDSGQAHSVGPLPHGSEIGGAFNIAGKPRSAFRIRLSCFQNGTPISGASDEVPGLTDESGAAAVDGRVTLP